MPNPYRIPTVYKDFPENADLSVIFRYSADDLDANRDGWISPMQAERLKARIADNQLFLSCLALTPIWGCGFFITFNILQSGNNPDRILLVGAFIGVLSLLARGVFVSRRNTGRDITDGIARSVIGPMTIRATLLGKHVMYFVTIGSKTFKIGAPDYKALKNHLNTYARHQDYKNDYTAYYAPRTNRLLSVEVTQ